jgi:VanZ family protein
MKSRIEQLQGLMPYVFVAMLLIVTWLMLVELGPARNGWPYWDKVQHMAVFAMLSALGFIAHAQAKTKVIIGLMVYGALIEWLQSLLTITRKASVGDWVADVAGILLLSVCFFAVKQRISSNT